MAAHLLLRRGGAERSFIIWDDNRKHLSCWDVSGLGSCVLAGDGCAWVTDHDLEYSCFVSPKLVIITLLPRHGQDHHARVKNLVQ